MLTFYTFNDTATTEIYTLSLHDALPIWKPFQGVEMELVVLIIHQDGPGRSRPLSAVDVDSDSVRAASPALHQIDFPLRRFRSEEHTSELQSHSDLVCRLLLEKKKIKMKI